MKKIEEFLDKYSKIILILIFVIGIVIYGFVASKMTSPTYIDVDEELYVSMAKSFFFDGKFTQSYQPLNYNCVLYSMILSIAYFFYSAKGIMFSMRMIGVILMISSIFPIYLLSKEIFKSKSKAIIAATISLLIPEFTSAFYLIQEVMCYPLFLWITYLIYLKFAKEQNKIRDGILIILLSLIFFVKSYAIVFPAAYFCVLCLIELKNKNYKKLGKVILEGFLCLGIIILGIVVLKIFNGYGNSHYQTQLESILPITHLEITAFLYGIFYYLAFFMLCLGFLPVLIPIFKIKSYEEKDRKFILFLVLSTLFTILEVSIIVFIPEEKGNLFPNKMCYRYLAPLAVPYVLMFLKCKKEEIKINKKIISVYVVCFAYFIIYYIKWRMVAVNPIESSFLTMLEAVSLKNFNKIAIIMLAVITVSIIILNKLKQIQDLKQVYLLLTITVLVILFPTKSLLDIHHSNVSCGGEVLRPEFIKIAEYIDRDYEQVYISGNWSPMCRFCLQPIYGYLKCNYRIIDISKEIDRYVNTFTKNKFKLVDEENEINTDAVGKTVALIVTKDFDISVKGLKKVELNNTFIDLYVSEGICEELKISLNT